MKKLILLTLAFTCFSKISHAQFASSGGNTTTNDKVGIGLSTGVPSAKLHINGTFLANGGAANIDGNVRTDISYLANSGQMLIGWNRSGGNGEANFITNRGGGGVGGFAFSDYSNSGLESLLFRILGNGAVGIGTPYPSSILHVASSSGSQVTFSNTSQTVVGNENQSLVFNGTNNGNNGGTPFELLRLKVTSTNGGQALGKVDFIQNNNTKPTLTFSPNSNIGINSVNPTSAIQIGDYGVSSSNALTIPGSYNFEQVKLGETPNGNSALEFVNHNGVGSSYGVKFLVDVDHGTPGLQLQYANPAYSYASLTYNTALYMAVDGTISIGTLTHPSGYKFAVGGNMIAEAVTVKLQSNWPDYVFKPDYKLFKLSEVENYIAKNHHLPSMPSEKEVVKNGVDLGEMLKLQQKKIEELTLYLIEKDKQIQVLQKGYNRLNNKLKKIIM